MVLRSKLSRNLLCSATQGRCRRLPHCFRSFAVYAVGEGWTGALTRQHILETIPGHYDEEEEDEAHLPVLIYPHDDIQQASVGWGISAIVDSQDNLQIVGRPHDLVSLLRMNRMPKMLQKWINRNHDTSHTTPVGTMISNWIGWATGNLGETSNQETWKIAEKLSLLDDWTSVNQRIRQVVCGPGFMAMVADCGSLYTMGVNNRGQCGTGTISNNIWTPQAVRGLSMTSASIGAGDKAVDEMAAEQDQPIVQVCLGFQQGYALSKAGIVFSWGKATRGQLGRVVDADQDPWARPIQLDQKVVEIGAGFHHGALLTEDNQVYVWGKNMSRKNPDTESSTSSVSDARKPELVAGLPTQTTVERISCGSHHTALLMEDGSVLAFGIASDEPIPILDPIELIPSGVLELPIRQFEAHQDRTTVVDNQGNAYQVHLWNDETLREYAYFTPAYVDALLDEGQQIESIHRGWRHTIIVTNSNS